MPEKNDEQVKVLFVKPLPGFREHRICTESVSGKGNGTLEEIRAEQIKSTPYVQEMSWEEVPVSDASDWWMLWPNGFPPGDSGPCLVNLTELDEEAGDIDSDPSFFAPASWLAECEGKEANDSGAFAIAEELPLGLRERQQQEWAERQNKLRAMTQVSIAGIVAVGLVLSSRFIAQGLTQ